MPAYVLAKRGALDLETTVFSAGSQGQHDALMAFTSEQAARDYRYQADWTESHDVAELSDAELVRWLSTAYHQGIQFLTVDPSRSQQVEGQPLPTLDIQQAIEACSVKLLDAMHGLSTANVS